MLQSVLPILGSTFVLPIILAKDTDVLGSSPLQEDVAVFGDIIITGITRYTRVQRAIFPMFYLHIHKPTMT